LTVYTFLDHPHHPSLENIFLEGTLLKLPCQIRTTGWEVDIKEF
jgi:hypothetical protein